MRHLKISQDIKNLNFSKIEENLFYYRYDLRNIKPLLKSNEHDESIENLATFNSFRGEVYENIIYELLLQYAVENESIKEFVLKGPHQNRIDKEYKTGLMIDRSLQIVYKSNYKDISEFDALFFTEDALYFVEMSTSKKTVSLNKRLDKKYALLKLLFPHLHIRALIILTEGTVGLRRFPSYCTIWITKDLEDIDFLKKIVFNRKKNGFKTSFNSSKFIEAYTIEHKKFIYFQTLEWILRRSRQAKDFIVDFSFLKSKKLMNYFDIYTKLYIGFLTNEEFKELVPSYDAEILNVCVTIEKINSTDFDIIYYVKNVNGKLRRVRLTKKETSIKEKELDGFTNAEVRFMKYLIEDKYYLTLDEVKQIKANLKSGLKQ
ncbi:hypothetical protein [Halarcobacter bivalviorum]|uniref:hypothetical protein n=1 Tax=Halarcobacter bivalviorum TaxID=663364 RepID=UPI00100A3FEA|nr:hypothetical protein [Halarcobacter bivalviorum]RXK07983.1 hypothetical protein CRU97_01155 [Halarcobacter bivalviorum]